MKLDVIPVHKTELNTAVRDYQSGRTVIVCGNGPLSGLTIDCYEAQTLRGLGYTTIGTMSVEVPL